MKFHDLRKTFGFILAQNSISTAVTQKLLEHSSPHLTNKVYTNVDPVLRHAVKQLPVGDWLEWNIDGENIEHKGMFSIVFHRKRAESIKLPALTLKLLPILPSTPR